MEKENVLEIKITKINRIWSLIENLYINIQELKKMGLNDKELEIRSSDFTNYEPSIDVFYIYFGVDKEIRKRPFLIENEYLDKFKRKIKLINEKYGTSKRWRAKKEEEYYYINDTLDIEKEVELNFAVDNIRYDIGNYFQTKEKAKKGKEKILEFFKTLHKEADNG